MAGVIYQSGAFDAVADGQKIAVNNFQLFLLDGSGNEYVGKVTDGSAPAQSYWADALPENGKYKAYIGADYLVGFEEKSFTFIDKEEKLS